LNESSNDKLPISSSKNFFTTSGALQPALTASSTIAFIANVGQKEDFTFVKKRALKMGAVKAIALDLQKEFVNDYVAPAIKASAVYENKYYLATALSRPLIAKHQVKIAQKEKTGKGSRLAGRFG